MIRILANDGIDEKGKAMLEKAGMEVVDAHYSAEALPGVLRDFDGITVRSATEVRKAVMDACPRLRLIGRGGVGMDNIDVTYALEKGIAVYNTPAASSRSVAELVFAHAFTLSRQLHLANREMPSRGLADFGKLKKTCSAGYELLGKTIGIFGFGRIGQEVARMALGLGLEVLATDPYVSEATIELQVPGHVRIPVTIKTVEPEKVLAAADIITVHIPKADKPILGPANLDTLKKGVLLINTARGGVFDEDTLIAGLASGRIGGIGLDVFTGEPSPRQDLLTHPAISLSPHIGGSTIEAQKNVGVELATYIIGHFNR